MHAILITAYFTIFFENLKKRTILIYVRTIFHVTLLYVYVVYRVKAVKIQK